VADFCITLEKLGRQANPDCTLEDRSLEYAQILLDNLSMWPEHFQLVGALHRAYEEVKQLALSIEQSKVMFGASRWSSTGHWRERAAQYSHYGDMSSTNGSMPHRKRVENVGEVTDTEKSGRRNYSSNWYKLIGQDHRNRYGTRRLLRITFHKKCLKYGHIARDCPQQSIKVNQVRKQGSAEKNTLSEIIRQARSLGMRVKRELGNKDELVGGRFVMELSLLGGRYPALIDTGSMISAVPVEILAKAQDRGVNVDALRFVAKSQLPPVFDASTNRMEFLGAVYIGGQSSKEGIEACPSKNDEIILGTNALSKLGVKVSIVGKKKKMAEGI
ncbi:hypothetical protein OSTOST_24249, partial [Ostertagia ostertagi]